MIQITNTKHLGLIFGPNGVGKGTLAHDFAEKFNLIHLNSGYLIRDWVKNDHHEELQTILDEGDFVSDEVVEIVWRAQFEKLANDNDTRNCVVEGMPRRHSQVAILKTLCEEFGYTIDWIIVLNAPLEEILHRVSHRVMAPDGEVYHMILKPPPAHFSPDQLIKRADDRPHIVEKRYHTYVSNTLECLADPYFKDIETYSIDATQSMQKVFELGEEFVKKFM